MYESPITIISNGIQLSLKDEVYKAVEQIDIKVDKDELIKALKYDRRQYEKGYADAKAEQKKGKWIECERVGAQFHPDYPNVYSVFCCTSCLKENYRPEKYCPNCGAEMENPE